MNAHKFVAEKGIEVVKQAIEEANAYGGDWIDTKTLELKKYIPSGDSVFIGELKQVVESLDTINQLCGLDPAKHTMVIAKEIGYTSDYEQIKQAIADYELVESYKQVKVEVLDMVDVSPRCEVRNG